MDSLSTLIALVPAPPGAAIYRRDQSKDGAAERIELRDARALFESGDVLVAHSAFVAGRLGSRANVMLFDVLELFAFVRPGMLRKILGAWFSFFLPGFHPWKHDDRALIAKAEAELGYAG